MEPALQVAIKLRAWLASIFHVLQFVGHILAPKSSTFGDLAPLLRRKAGLPDGTELSIFEEIKFEPTVMCQPQRPQDTLMNGQLEHGDILCIQEAVSPVSDLARSADLPRNVLVAPASKHTPIVRWARCRRSLDCLDRARIKLRDTVRVCSS